MMKKTSQIKQVKIDELIPYVNNARTHSEEQIKKIRASLREFGFVNPVLIDAKNNIIAGHGRVESAKREGIDEVPCVLVEHLTETQKKAYILADNRLAEDAGWDMDLLKIEFEHLNDMDFDISLTGFEDDFWQEDEEKEIERKDISENIKSEYNLIIEFENEKKLEIAYEKLTKEGYDCKVSTF